MSGCVTYLPLCPMLTDMFKSDTKRGGICIPCLVRQDDFAQKTVGENVAACEVEVLCSSLNHRPSFSDQLRWYCTNPIFSKIILWDELLHFLLTSCGNVFKITKRQQRSTCARLGYPHSLMEISDTFHVLRSKQPRVHTPASIPEISILERDTLMLLPCCSIWPRHHPELEGYDIWCCALVLGPPQNGLLLSGNLVILSASLRLVSNYRFPSPRFGASMQDYLKYDLLTLKTTFNTQVYILDAIKI